MLQKRTDTRGVGRSTLHGVLENGADLRVNERQKIRHYRARSTEERRIRRRSKFSFRHMKHHEAVENKVCN